MGCCLPALGQQQPTLPRCGPRCDFDGCHTCPWQPWGEHEGHTEPLAPLGSETTKAGTDTGVQTCGGMLCSFDHICVCMYICRSPAMLEDFHCLQEPLQVRFIFLTLLRKAGTPLSQKSDTTKMCLILPESWFPLPSLQFLGELPV